MNNVFQCQRCGYDCQVEGEYPRFDCYCDACKKPAEGFDVLEYAAEWYAHQIDAAMTFKDE